MIPLPDEHTMRMQGLIEGLVNILSIEDIEDGCYEGLPIMAYNPSTGTMFRIVGVGPGDADLPPHIVITEV
jgi:hypothetical protein